MKKAILTFACFAAMCVNQLAVANTCYELPASAAVFVSGNPGEDNMLYKATPGSNDDGDAAGLYSTTYDPDQVLWAEVSFDGNPQPLLTDVYLKAANGYLHWDKDDLAAFNSGPFDCIKLYNSIANRNGILQQISHIQLDGTPGVPDGGTTLSLLGLGLLGLGIIRRQKG